ncbi:MAG TPA: 4a-hydroxytetrahydrobiopterin dehydratase [Thermoanaerobaculia bacterium]|nr:4a-hydroxytetrahydrobiopterin dehydratase [Thermoanaerobaculia bacterium]
MDAHSLAAKTCVPCRGGIPPLTEEKAREFVAATPGWTLAESGTRLFRRFEFRDFKAAIEFVNRVADLAEQEGHHPDIAIHWNKVELTLWTHKIGGLHENDFILAAKVDRLLDEPKTPAEVAG